MQLEPVDLGQSGCKPDLVLDWFIEALLDHKTEVENLLW